MYLFGQLEILLFFTLLQLRIITIRSIKRAPTGMPRYTVFRHCCRSQCLGIFVKQTVMPHTKSDHNIQVRLALFRSFACRIGLHIFTPTPSQHSGMPTDVFFCVPALQPTPYTSKPCLRRISARIRLSFNNPTQVAIPSFSH